MSIEQQFEAAVKVIQSLPKDGFFQPSNEMKLRFYALFKQATEGPNRTRKPAFYDLVNRYKWAAWQQCGEMDRGEAMKLYVEELKKVVETISLSHEVSEFLDLLGPFYEFLPEELTGNNNENNQRSNEEDNQIKTNLDSNSNKSNSNSNSFNFSYYDSDGDEFTDTNDITPEKIPAVFKNISTPESDQKQYQLTLCNSSFSTTIKTNPEQNEAILTNNDNNATLSFNEQLAMEIFQLQQSIDEISTRMDKIEQKITTSIDKEDRHGCKQSLTKSNNQNKPDENNRHSIWPFNELSQNTTIFLLSWPVLVYLLMNYFKRFRKK